MRVVSQFESDLLRILQGVVSQPPPAHIQTPPAHIQTPPAHIQTPLDQIQTRLLRGQPRPDCLCRDAVEMIEKSLATGVVMRITRSGAWQSSRSLRDGVVVEGSLWARTPPEELGLSFSTASLDLLVYLTAAQGAESIPAWVPDPKHAAEAFTLGDRVLQYFVAGAMADLPLLSDWFRQDPFVSNQLIALTMPDRFAAVNADPKLNFEAWMTGSEAIFLEAMQPEFADWMVRMVHLKSSISDPQQAEEIGLREERALNDYLAAAGRHRRPDLCRFMLSAAEKLLSESTSVRRWLPMLDTSKLKLSQRVVAYRSGASLLRAIRQLADWHRLSRSIGYFDEGYQESQWLKLYWEQIDGDQLSRHAERMLAELDL